MWQQPIALFTPPVPGALAWRKCRCKEASQTCKTFMVGRWSAWKVSDGECEWEWASEWASGWVSEEEWAKPDWSLQSRQRISHWDPSSWKHWIAKKFIHLCLCLSIYLFIYLCNIYVTSPFVLSERVGVDNFIVINQEDMTPLTENASIESETPRYFQVNIS